MISEFKNREVHLFEKYSDWETWLSKNHNSSPGIWIVFAKKGSPMISVTYTEAREVALRFGWIDGIINGYDEQCYQTKFTPRRPKSPWSKINREIVEGLIRDGRMEPSGLIEVEKAQITGTWDRAYDPPSRMEIPEDFMTTLEANTLAYYRYKSLKKSDTYSMLHAIATAPSQAARARRISKYIDELSKV